MDSVQGLEWPEAELGPLCPGPWVEEVDPEDLPGDEFSSEVWWVKAQDKGDELADYLTGQEALDARLSLELANARWHRCEKARVQFATDKVTSLFFQAQSQRDLDAAFAFMATVKDRGFIAKGVVALAKARVARGEREARQAQIDNLRELNRAMSEWARSISYRVRLDGKQESVTQVVRDQSWVLVQLRPGIGQVCRGKNVNGKTVLMAEPEIFGLMEARTA